MMIGLIFRGAAEICKIYIVPRCLASFLYFTCFRRCVSRSYVEVVVLQLLEVLCWFSSESIVGLIFFVLFLFNFSLYCAQQIGV